MRMFGSSIRYLTVDLIEIFKSSRAEEFEGKRDRYLASQHEPENSYYYRMDYGRMAKMVDFIDRYLDSVTCENEMKMEIYFHQDQPAFIDDEVNDGLFDFSYADKIYQFAQDNGLNMRIHTILWYWHVPKQLMEYLENRSAEDRRRLGTGERHDRDRWSAGLHRYRPRGHARRRFRPARHHVYQLQLPLLPPTHRAFERLRESQRLGGV